MSDEQLAARVKAVNRCHLEAHKVYMALTEIFTPLVGQKIEKADGNLLASVAKLLPKFPCTPNLSVFQNRSNYTLGWTVKTSEVVNGCAYYHDVTVYIGEMDGGVLTKIMDHGGWRCHYTVDEVKAARCKLAAAIKALAEASSACQPFGERD